MTAQPAQDEETGVQYRGLIIIEWPPPNGEGPHAALLGTLISITDAHTGKPITACSHADIVVRADASDLVTADLTLHTDADGEPILDAAVLTGKETAAGVFPFLVAEMRVRSA